MKTKDVIIFAGALYDDQLWTNRQHIATQLADRGWRVLYVEPRIFVLTRLLHRRARYSSLVRAFQGPLVRWRPRANLWVVTQTNSIPGSRRWAPVARFNHFVNAPCIRWHARRLGFSNPALLIYDTEAAEFLDDFPASRVVYDCVDDHRSQAGVRRNQGLVDREEAALVARAAAISVTTQPLLERLSTPHGTAQLVPNAADIVAFLDAPKAEPADIAAIPHPRIGTVGALDAYKLDVQLIAAAAVRHPDWHFVLVGPRGYAGRAERAEVAALENFPNIHFLGPKPRADVPAYVHGFDVTMIPYRANAYNAASFPLKFWEFMASGKPVVISGLPALAQYGQLVDVTHTPAEFSAAIEERLRDPARGQAARVTEAARHRWETRVAQIERLLTD